jgi:hypothetical protein
MNRLTEQLLDRIATWPEEARAELMRSIVEIEEKHVGTYRLSDDERAAVQRGLNEMRQQRYASEEKIAAIFNRHRS